MNTTEYASWVLTALEYAREQITADSTWNGGLVIVENGKIVTGERMGEIFKNGLTDREELNVASVNFRNNMTPDDQNPDKPQQPSDSQKPDVKDELIVNGNTTTDSKKKPSKVKTSDIMNIAPYAMIVMLSGVVLVSLKLKKKGSQ